MTIGQILVGVPLKTEIPAVLAQTEVTGLDYDSRRVEPGFLFFAFAGAKADGRAFANSAREKGAVAIISEQAAPEGFSGSWVQVEHGRRAMAQAARNFYQQHVELTGITGTNGKTTTGFLIDSVLRASGRTTALIGTIEYHLGNEVLPAVNTTPESVDLYRLFDRLAKMGGTHATMEVSSHALALGRVYGLEFHTAVFTNLTRDHLDFHQTMEEYFAAKRILFDSGPKFAVINGDDPYGPHIQTAAGTEVLTYGFDKDATVRASKVSSTFEGLRFEVVFGKIRFAVESPLIGRINVYNILAACGAGLTYQIPVETIVQGIANCHGVPGRFERIDEGQPFAVVVDYSHTDDALRNAILVARGLSPKRLITVFGCGGDRDRTKRPMMGAVAGELSDRVILTSDNPRSEDPLEIMNDVLVGLRRYDKPILVEPDRATAIQRALEEAAAGDIVILAGKGHETYQVLKDRTIAFDDRAVAREVLRGFGYKKSS
jgi:UDP-N-acetylmuramoyl-L-alanyl-D-glutamate--2,6-diaminopimelate ligase